MLSMQFFLRRFREFVRAEDGATAIEYAVLGGMLAVAIILGAQALGIRLGEMYDAVANKITVPT